MALRTAAYMILRLLLLLAVLVGLTGNPVSAEPTRYQSSTCDGRIFPNYATAYAFYLRGNGCAEDGRYARAVEDYSRAIELEPDYVQAYAQRGLAYFNQGDYELATADYEAYERIAGQMEPFMVEQINVMESPPDTRETSLTTADCDQLLDLETDDAQAFFDRALVCFEVENYDQAADDLLMAIHQDEHYYPLALAHFTDVIRDADPPDAQAYVIRGQLYLSQDELDLAWDDFHQALKDPMCLRVDLGLSFFYIVQGENEKAIKRINQLFNRSATAFGYYTRGAIYNRMADYQAAAYDAQQVLYLSVEDAEAIEVYKRRFRLYANQYYDEVGCDEVLGNAEPIVTRVDTGEVVPQAYKGDVCLVNRAKATTDLDMYERLIYEPTKILSQKSTNSTNSTNSTESTESTQSTDPKPFKRFIVVVVLLIVGSVFVWIKLNNLYQQSIEKGQ